MTKDVSSKCCRALKADREGLSSISHAHHLWLGRPQCLIAVSEVVAIRKNAQGKLKTGVLRISFQVGHGAVPMHVEPAGAP